MAASFLDFINLNKLRNGYKDDRHLLAVTLRVKVTTPLLLRKASSYVDSRYYLPIYYKGVDKK